MRVTKRAFATLPDTIRERYFRGDSACDDEALLTWLRNEKREDGPEALIGFAVSARMNPALREEIEATPAEKWQPYSEDSEAVKECAQVNYFPEETPENRHREPLRYIAIRIRKKQQQLFADGSEVKYFAVATNLWDWKPKRLALPPELLTARPKRLRFLIFNTPGRLIRHARAMVLRMVRTWGRFSNWKHALAQLPLPSTA